MSGNDDKTGFDDTWLEADFATARDAAPDPSDALMARVMADADAVQAEMARARGMPAAPRRGLAGVWRALGGWPAVAGLSTAAVTGIWIGVAPPDALAVTAQSVLGSDVLLALDGGDDVFLTEEAL